MKRSFDIFIAITGLILLALPLLVISLLIKMTSAGPVIFRQNRIGRYGKPFCLYKFRTMRSGGGSQITVGGDPRITGIGRLLRRFKLDEIPQLFNVLCGQMSIIGPRPEVERFVRHYNAEQRRILEQRPGLAGFAQLVYPHEAQMLKDSLTPEKTYVEQLLPKKIAADLAYEERRTFWSDLGLFVEIILLSFGKSYRIDKDFKIVPEQSVEDLRNPVCTPSE